MDADGHIKNAYSSPQPTRERFFEDVEDEASRRNETTGDEKLAKIAVVPPRAPYAVQRAPTSDFAAPVVREKLVAMLAANTTAALG